MHIDEFTRAILMLTEMARNGAVVTGPATNATKFREECLEHILSLLAQDIIPYLRENDLVNGDKIWDGLTSLDCLEWKTVVRVD